MIIIAILLLFVRAMSDLALPDYMSDIVNKGIQQGGIVNAVPEVVRQSNMEKLTLFMSEEEKTQVMDQYILVDKSSPDFDVYMNRYPVLIHESVYVLQSKQENVVDMLNPIMGKAFLGVSGVEEMKATAQEGFITFNDRKIPVDTDLFALIAQLPPEQVEEMMEGMNAQFLALGETMVTQVAVTAVKREYEAIGLNTDQIQSNYIIHIGMWMLLIALLSAISTVMVGLIAARVGAGLSRSLRRGIFQKVESFSKAEFESFSTASLITRTTNDVTQVEMLVIILLRMVFYAPIMGVGGVMRAVDKSSSMSWVIAVAVIVLLGMILLIFSIVMPKFQLVQKLVDKLNLVSRENLSGMMVIRAFNTQKFQEKRFDGANQELTRTNLFVNRVMAVMSPMMMLVMNGITLLIVWVGADQIENSGMQVGDMMAFMQYAMQIIMSFLMLSMMFIMVPRASVSLKRIAEVLQVEPIIVEPKKPKKFPSDSIGVVSFEKVSFKYPGAEDNALENITFEAKPGGTTAIIGSTGSGKTTLINLILRFYDVTEGKLAVDGVDIRDVSQQALRDKIGYVPQKASLFSGTIESNLKYADENASDDDLKKAAEIAQAIEFIQQKPKGFLGEISQGGGNVSGGQKQRLSIARALVKKPDIYIFDDSFSALDFQTEAKLRRELKSITKNSTVFLVAQRISSIMHAEQIIVLDQGKVMGIGTHKELMEKCNAYKEIALSQFSKEELA